MTQREQFMKWYADEFGDEEREARPVAWEAWQAAQPPLDPTPEMIEAGAQALVQWACDGLTWPDSWDALDVQSARRDAEKAYRAMVWEYMKQ